MPTDGLGNLTHNFPPPPLVSPPHPPTAKLLPVLVESLGGPNAHMPRLQAAAAGAIITFCNPERLRAEWLNEPAGPPGSKLGQEEVGLVLLRSLAGLVPSSGSSCIVVREEALTAVGIVSQVCVCRGGAGARGVVVQQ